MTEIKEVAEVIEMDNLIIDMQSNLNCWDE